MTLLSRALQSEAEQRDSACQVFVTMELDILETRISLLTIQI